SEERVGRVEEQVADAEGAERRVECDRPAEEERACRRSEAPPARGPIDPDAEEPDREEEQDLRADDEPDRDERDGPGAASEVPRRAEDHVIPEFVAERPVR